MQVEVLARDGMWSLDQIDFGRAGHESVRGLAVSDNCTRRILEVSVGPPATGKDVLALLERAAAERGGKYPFVVQMDNGSENQNALVRAWAVEHEVILLFNIPHAAAQRACGAHERRPAAGELAGQAHPAARGRAGGGSAGGQEGAGNGPGAGRGAAGAGLAGPG
ncbi:MAG: hypothetical protein IPK67_06560 [Planctomycetes bacterium]|nr:hypothetical protein [Planctomycetota bacterium]